jgi:hypothetical protein
VGILTFIAAKKIPTSPAAVPEEICFRPDYSSANQNKSSYSSNPSARCELCGGAGGSNGENRSGGAAPDQGAGDVMQGAAIEAWFVYNAATRPEMLPRLDTPLPLTGN